MTSVERRSERRLTYDHRVNLGFRRVEIWVLSCAAAVLFLAVVGLLVN